MMLQSGGSVECVLRLLNEARFGGVELKRRVLNGRHIGCIQTAVRSRDERCLRACLECKKLVAKCRFGVDAPCEPTPGSLSSARVENSARRIVLIGVHLYRGRLSFLLHPHYLVFSGDRANRVRRAQRRGRDVACCKPLIDKREPRWVAGIEHGHSLLTLVQIVFPAYDDNGVAREGLHTGSCSKLCGIRIRIAWHERVKSPTLCATRTWPEGLHRSCIDVAI